MLSWNRISLIIIAVALVLLLTVYSLRAARVTVALPEKGPAVEAVYATGTVEGTEMFPIAARIPGRILELQADEGWAVDGNQLLVKLDDSELRHTLEERKARLEFARQDFERNEKLFNREASAKSELDRSRAEWKASIEAVAAAEAQLEYTKLFAPAAGTIVRRDGEIGELVPAYQAIMWMTTDQPLRITAEVDEEDIALIEPGQTVLVRADAFPDRSFKGFVQSITPKGDAVARSFRVRIGLSEETPLRLGMTAESNIIIKEAKDALLIPAGALQSKNTVWIVKNGRLLKKIVQVGVRGEFKVEILDGISIEDRVLLEPDEKLSEGQRVRESLLSAGE